MPICPFKSILNFRDVGKTINSLRPQSPPLLQPSLLYRSARPDEASPADRHALATTYGIKTIIDLRSKTEHIEQAKKHGANIRSVALVTTSDDAAIEPWRISGVNYVNINLNGGAFSRALLWRLGWISLIKLGGLMAAGYRAEGISILGREVMAPRGLVGLGRDSLDFCHEEIRQVFGILAEESNYPIMIHCTQGKDRTGLIVTLVLLLLEVPIETIAADYAISDRELEPEKEKRLEEIGNIGLGEEFCGCPIEFVQDMKNYIDEKYGGGERYLEECNIHQQTRDSISNLLLFT
ncbi:MAG: hypothetical protein Q9164_003012 [Protoblastenia rupestris]